MTMRRPTSRARKSLQLLERLLADLAAGRPLRDGADLLQALAAWRVGRGSIEEAMGFTADVRRMAMVDEVAMAAVRLAGQAPCPGNGLLGAARAAVCQARLDEYAAGAWLTERHLKAKPEGAAGDAWLIIFANSGKVPSITKLRKISTRSIEKGLANISVKFARQRLEASIDSAP